MELENTDVGVLACAAPFYCHVSTADSFIWDNNKCTYVYDVHFKQEMPGQQR